MEKKESEHFNIEMTETVVQGAKIVVVGVGGGGGNMVNHLVESGLAENVKTIAANTDMQALEECNADVKIQLGPKTTGGKGAGMDPEIGKKAALESYDEIVEALKKT